MTLTRRKLAWGGVLALLVVVLAGAVILNNGSGKKQASRGRRGKVSQMLLDLTSGAKGLDAIRVPEGFEVSLAAGPDLVSYPMFAVLDDRGRLFLCESAGKNTTDQEAGETPSFRIRMIEDIDGDGAFDRTTVFADRITMSMGAQWYRGSLYVAAPPDLVRYTDTNNDGVADRREVILTGWPLKANATTLHGPYLGPDGWMYLTYSPSAYKVQTKEGPVLQGPGGRVFRLQPDGTRLEWFVGGGFDNPVEVTFTPAGETIGTMTYYSQPMNGVRDALLHYVDGAVYPKWTAISDNKMYKRTGDLMPAVTKFARVAPAGLHYYRSDHLGADYKGNLFSAHFNPHRILRHILHREDGTFRTDDSDFLTSEDIDFHPTDVLEDADGSLLVVDTGGWFLHGCPVSRISKPQFKGAVYRVRRKNAPRVDDPRGGKLGMADAAPAELARLLEDPRFAVRDQAVDRLVQAAVPAIQPLALVLQKSASPEARTAAVFALGRIPNPKSAEAVRAALSDRDVLVRVAAARMAGLNQDQAAVSRLAEMVKRDDAAVRRQAAEALGRIGDTSAVPALLAASADLEGRFVEHAVIYALIRLRQPAPVIEALSHSNPQVRKAALIALDQMDGNPLRREHLVAQLNATNEQLSNAALWVAGHHPDWSADIRQFLRTRLEKRSIGEEEAESLRRTVLPFCSDEGTQQMLVDLLVASSNDADRQVFLLDTMDRCSLEKMPASWIAQIRQLLDRSHVKVHARVVTLAGSRRILEAGGQLERIAGDQSQTPGVRVAALIALAAHRPGLADSGFRFLLETLRTDQDAEVRLSAAQALSKTNLSKEQLLALARDYLGQADPLVLPVLFNAFDHSREEHVARALVDALLNARAPLSGMAGERLEELLKNYSRSVQTAAKPLLDQVLNEKNSRAARLKELEPLLTAGGDIGRGRQMFFGKKVACSSCHTIGPEGGHVGPDLTSVGAVRSGLDILEAIVFPSASFVPGHEVYRVTTANAVYTGVRQGSGSGGMVVLVSGPGDVVRIPAKEVVSMEPSTVSLMPDGFDTALTQAELTDLLAFLQSQTSRQAALATD
ncbi:MAG: PVC-type heme-binding CxxCH protein [Bryobacteraceae bacterium]